MEIIFKIIDFVATCIMAYGAGYAIVGLINFSEGHSQQNAAKKEEGIGKVIGGASIFGAGLALIPLIKELLPSGGVIGLTFVSKLVSLLLMG